MSMRQPQEGSPGRFPVMRLISACLLLMISSMLLAQVPIGFGPGTQGLGRLDFFDWYLGNASGCSTAQGANGGPRGMCTGAFPHGDTQLFTGWFADSSLLPITTGLPVVGTFNDCTMKTCSGNVALAQLAEFNWSNRNASRFYELNCMNSMNGADR